MLEAFRRISGDSENYKLTRFAPFEELQRLLDHAPEKNLGTYLNQEFRDLLGQYGVDYDMPLGLRIMGRLFSKQYMRRAAVMVAQTSFMARALVIDTDSLVRKVYPGEPMPHDVNTADILVWPMQMRKRHPSDKPWYVGAHDHVDPDKVKFLIVLKRLGNSNFVETYEKRVTDRGFSYWDLRHDISPIHLLKNWAGL